MYAEILCFSELCDISDWKVINSIFNVGYNATVLAYGQTGSGKTHTMGGGWGEHSGTADEVGIIPRVIGELFGGIEEARERFVFVVRVSYLEVCSLVIGLLFSAFPSVDSSYTSVKLSFLTPNPSFDVLLLISESKYLVFGRPCFLIPANCISSNFLLSSHHSEGSHDHTSVSTRMCNFALKIRGFDWFRVKSLRKKFSPE